MRHIDNAHQAEGNRQAQRGEQQYAAQAQAIEGMARQLQARQATLNIIKRFDSGQAHGAIRLAVTAVGFLLNHDRKHGLNVWITR